MAADDRTGEYENSRQAQTTDATVTTAWDWIIPDESAALVEVVVVGIQSGSGNTASYKRIASVERQSGTAALVGSVTTDHSAEDDAAWDCTIDVSGNDVRVRVTGVAATTIDWFTWAKIRLFRP